MKNKYFSIYFIAFVFLEGLALGSVINKYTGALLSRIITGISLLVLAFYGRRIETAFHRSDMESWQSLRLRGKSYFILTRYIFARGIILSMVFFVPLLTSIQSYKTAATILFFGYCILSMFLWMLGRYEWNNCETEYTVSLLKDAGQQVRLMQN